MDHVRNYRSGVVSVTGPTNREETRIVAVSFLEQYVERPLTTGTDREIRRTESRYACPAYIFENGARGANVLTKLFRCERIDTSMPVAVRCDFVTGFRDAANDTWMVIGNPSEREEGSGRTMSRK